MRLAVDDRRAFRIPHGSMWEAIPGFFAKVSGGNSRLRFEKPIQPEPAALKRLLRDLRKLRKE